MTLKHFELISVSEVLIPTKLWPYMYSLTLDFEGIHLSLFNYLTVPASSELFMEEDYFQKVYEFWSKELDYFLYC